MGKNFIPHSTFQPELITFTLGSDRSGKTTINMTYGPSSGGVEMISSAALTMWPRCTGDGNFGTMWGPQDVSKAKFTLDLCDTPINDAPNDEFNASRAKLDVIDDTLLDFVTENQLKVLGRKNLTRDEIKMLQIRSVRPKYDKMSGVLTGHNLNLSATKFAGDGMGGRYERKITICDHTGVAIPAGVVCPGDVVAATMFANQVYTGVGGDKFGIHWSFQDVSVICQRGQLEQKAEVSAFASIDWAYSKPYIDQVSEMSANEGVTAQFLDTR